MSVATGLIAKLLLAVSVIPAAGYGGYCVYDHYNPTFHNQLIQQGFLFSPISGDLGSDQVYYQKRSKITEGVGGDWRCSKQLFLDLVSPATNTKDTQDESEENVSVPSSPEATESIEDDYEGCLVADLGYPSDTNKKASFLKWELALRSGDKGFIYAGFFSLGKIKDDDGSGVDGTFTQQSANTVFEVKKEEGKWGIKNGLNWMDYFTSYDGQAATSFSSLQKGFSDVEMKIVLPNGHEWKSNGNICGLNENAEGDKCPGQENWTFKRYVGFWEKNEMSEQQAIDAIKISATKDNTEHLHDIWSQNDFDFSDSTQTIESGNPAWSNSISYVYDVEISKWKSVKGALGAKDYLKAIYSPWAKKKGTWMEADGVCYESNNRHLNKESEEAKRLLKFCYKK